MLLVQFAGLNPMGSRSPPRAGCPKQNIRKVLYDMVNEAGLTVVLYPIHCIPTDIEMKHPKVGLRRRGETQLVKEECTQTWERLTGRRVPARVHEGTCTTPHALAIALLRNVGKTSSEAHGSSVWDGSDARSA